MLQKIGKFNITTPFVRVCDPSYSVFDTDLIDNVAVGEWTCYVEGALEVEVLYAIHSSKKFNYEYDCHYAWELLDMEIDQVSGQIGIYEDMLYNDNYAVSHMPADIFADIDNYNYGESYWYGVNCKITNEADAGVLPSGCVALTRIEYSDEYTCSVDRNNKDEIIAFAVQFIDYGEHDSDEDWFDDDIE